MIISEIKLFQLLKQRIGEKEAEAFLQILDERVHKKFEENKAMLATKEDLANVKSDLQKTIYLTSLGQLFAIVASVVSLILVINS